MFKTLVSQISFFMVVTVLSVNAYSQSRAYVAHQGGSGFVHVVDLATNTQIGSIPLGSVPNQVAVSPDGTRGYVSLWNNTVAVLDTVAQSVLTTIPVSPGPFGVAVSSDGARAYIANTGGNNVSVIDTATNSVIATVAVGTYPVGVALGPDGDHVYIANHVSNTISVIDTATNLVSSTFSLTTGGLCGPNGPWTLSIAPNGDRAVATNINAGCVTIIDLDNSNVITKIGIGGSPYSVDISPDGGLAYVAVEHTGSVKVIDLALLTLASSIPEGISPWGIVVSGDGSRVYVANYNSGFTTIDTSTQTVIGNIPMAQGTAHIALWEAPNTDATPPIIAPAVIGILGNAGWYTGDVDVSWAVTDAESAVSSASGCDAIVVTTDTTGTTFTCTATSGGGTATQSVTIKRDATAPAISCGSADGIWHSADISIACGNSDATSGLASASDANFSLSTSVASGTETANASTDSRPVCDNAGNCASAGPINGNMIDKKAPAITIVSPASGGYIFNQSIFVNYTCTDGGSLVAVCNGTTLNGGLLDTGSIGNKTFTVNSTDNVGNSTSTVVNYIVSYRVPTDKDECKKGGWQTLQRANGTLFNNQGDCVSYVNTGH